MRAAVLREFGAPLDVVDHLETVATGAGQVKVRIRATGLCHSDLSAMNGLLGLPAPFVPGHEGAGEIVEVGEGVTSVAPGDRVIVNFMPPCGACPDCANGEGNMCMSIAMGASATPNFTEDGEPVFGLLGCGTFAEEVVLPHQSVVKVAEDVPFDIAALIGCGVTTGVGAVLNTARVEKGSTVAVVGCGGVGIAAVMGARLAGAEQIVAIDPSAAKRALVGSYGATAAVSPEEAKDTMAELTGGRGFDHTFEVVGRSATAQAAYDLVRRGGTMTVVGIGGAQEVLPLSLRAFAGQGKRVLASTYGGTDVPRFMSRLVDLWRDGRLDLGSMITGRSFLDDINKGFDLMKTGDAVRTVVEF
ncbi:alcohol dehydrogenase catalytic domain-containing protein [Streptomyces abyssomicinicus]|uniref:alcohol dehydrogenase catalytic domain-containing protein n=1 Tax=Streptomyces abyssomicinicus TaxID=574929 RepID=UPI00124F9A2D|nr:alcohol dehydrogenase catalytic domain-containing protein [Streptomyces abyssomicinicus]